MRISLPSSAPANAPADGDEMPDATSQFLNTASRSFPHVQRDQLREAYDAAWRALNVLKAQGESVRPGNVLDALADAIAKAEGKS
jgi:hypothetical protein